MSIMNDGEAKTRLVIRALQERGVMRSCELGALGVSREHLRRLLDRGIIVRVGHGLYRLPDSELTAYHSLVEASRRLPYGVICLLSALRYHQVTTQVPFEVWVAIDRRAWHPQITDFPIRLVSYSGPALTEGIEEHTIEGVPVRIYSLAKTVADCFKYRNKIGLDVALEALRESLRAKRVTVDALWMYAKICRVTNVMRPYLEAMI
jgi:predicted transcriptional regulator of viral defense system